MNSEITIRRNIENALKAFDEQPLREASTALLNTLGYYSKLVGRDEIDSVRFDGFMEAALETANPSQRLRVDDWHAFYQILQVTDNEINAQITEEPSLFESKTIDNALRRSYMFVAMQLTGETYTRPQIANMTRFISREAPQPILFMFRYADVLTLAIINRRTNKRDDKKQVLEKVTLIKDIDLNSPKRAHIDIISELTLHRLIENEDVRNFDTLHDAWEDILNTEALNKRFYRDLEAWYEWAASAETCKFPDKENKMQVIRMITRLLFMWFLKEKRLVPSDLFERESAQTHLKNFDAETSDYYQAILQNLFFATLNTPLSDRAFGEQNNGGHQNANKYCYEDLLRNPDGFLEYLKQVPFVNGGLFDSLDSLKEQRADSVHIDCFTDDEIDRQKLHVPAKLFFEKDSGIFEIFSRYKFTIEENTPVDQEVALDPELLGQVFENLLGVYNPESETAARKATGSYYTPRQIVNYMVDEALIAYFLEKVEPYDGGREWLETRLREDLFAYDRLGDKDKPNDHLIHEDELGPMIDAVDTLEILDPAVGSGAFPMGILNKLVLILKKLDPENKRWKQRQIEQAERIPDLQSREAALASIAEVFSAANQYNNYGRKLYLIQNCIYGVDIQPIAVTIAKLRFFISLVIEQESNDTRNVNYGIRPLPNLETKLVAANTLIGLTELNQPDLQLLLANDSIQQLRQEIKRIRVRYFGENNRQVKLEYIANEERYRGQLAAALATEHETWCRQEKDRIAEKVARMPKKKAQQQLQEKLQKAYAIREAKLTAGIAEAKRIADWYPYDQNAAAGFFDPEWMFGIQDKFDIVIGNPPYGAKISQVALKQIKTNLQDTGNSNSAALFIDYSKNQLMKPEGTLAFIVPKSLLYSKTWQSLAFVLSEKATVLVDVERAFEKVLLEQVVFVYSSGSNNAFYTARKFVNHTFTQTTEIPRTYPKVFEAWICDVSIDEIQLGLKVNRVGTHLSEISQSRRGLSVQKFLKATGEVKVIGGREVNRYGISGVKGYANHNILSSADRKIQSLLQPKIISQNIVTRKQIKAHVDEAGDILGVDTVENTFLTDSNFSMHFVAALFNSTLINWYAHRFIFCSALLTMHFDNYYIGKIPIPLLTLEDQQSIVELVEQILSTKQEDPEADSTEMEKQIDKLIYTLYGLTETEIAIVEEVIGIEV